MNKIQIAMSGGMNWDWFLAYSINHDGTITRHAEERFHRSDSAQGADLNHLLLVVAKHAYEVIEIRDADGMTASPRTACAIRINGIEYALANHEPRFVYQAFNWNNAAE